MKWKGLLFLFQRAFGGFFKRKPIYLLKVLLPVVGFGLLLSGCHGNFPGVIDPKGIIAAKQARLIMDAIALMMIVVLPVIVMSFVFAFRYRNIANNKSTYKPNWSHSVMLECVWWGVPCLIIIILGIMTWISSHKLDPYRKLDVPGKVMLIQAVSLRWKWLFIYPEQHIATVNYIAIPKNTQVQFWITSDAPMSAFFIPQLGSQIYSMAGMRTRLHLVANQEGVYEGLNSQFNGAGFSDMHFKVDVTDQTGFKRWVDKVKSAKASLNIKEYQKIVRPSIASPVMYFSSVYPHLFNRIMEQYTKPNMRLH